MVAAAPAPGAVAAEVDREAGIHANQLFRWRQETVSAGISADRIFRARRFVGAGLVMAARVKPSDEDRGQREL